jgi:hypothetical protein
MSAVTAAVWRKLGCIPKTQGPCLVVEGTIDRPDGSTVTPRQYAWNHMHMEWVDDTDLSSTCDTPGCVKHLGEQQEEPKPDPVEEQVVRLVQRKSVTLADLYRKGRAKGLLTSIRGYL